MAILLYKCFQYDEQFPPCIFYWSENYFSLSMAKIDVLVFGDII